MKKTCLLGILAVVVPAHAHHAFSAEYDKNKPIEVKGEVTKVEWLNLHAHFFADVKDPKGKVTTWEFELGSPNVLMRQGWNRYSLKKGDIVTVNGSQAKDGSRIVNASSIVMPDGRRVFAGSSGDEPAKQV